LQLKAHENIIISFSMSPHKAVQTYDLKTPPLAGRIKAMAKIAAHGYPVGLHFDPIIYSEDFQEQYAELMVQVMEQIDDAHVYYVSVGVVRFTKEVYRAFKNNYPDSPLLGEELVGGQDQMVRYPRPMRLHILNTVKNIIGMGGIAPEKVYLCME
jgi:spore photoproduct lyase